MDGRPSRGRALEREAELAQISAAFHDAAGGNGRLIVIEGPPGIGKTRLVDEARAMAKELGFARMKAVGEEFEQGITWGVVRQLVERSILRYSGETRETILAGAAGRALAAIEAGSGELDEAELARTMHALWWVAADLSSDRPLLITVDDAQWADPPSLGFLAYLARRLEDLSVCLIVSTRPPGHGGALAELTSGRHGQRLLPEPLSAVAVEALGEGAHPDVVAAVRAASGGNPFYAEQLYAELERQGQDRGDPAAAGAVAGLGPETVARGLLMHLGPEARALAAAAAVLGTRSAPRVAIGLAQLSGPAGAAAADELRAAHVLGEDAQTLAFTHPVVREAVLAGLRPGERSTLHGAAARALHAEGAPGERIAAQLAHAPAGSLPGAEHLLRDAADRALAQGDTATATGLLRRVLDEAPGDHAAEVQLGLALVQGEGPEEGGRLLRTAATRTDDPAVRARCLAGAADATAAISGPRAAIEELREARASFGAGRTPAGLLIDARLAMATSYLFERAPGSAQHLTQFHDLEGDTVVERTLLALLTQRSFNQGDPAEPVLALARRTFGRDPSMPTGLDFLALSFATFALSYAGAIEETEAVLRSARTRIRETGSPADFMVLCAASAQLGWRTGDVARAAAESTAGIEAIVLAEASPQTEGIRAVLTRQAVLAALERSDLATAGALLEAHDRHAAAPTVPVERVREARAAFALAQDDPATAHAEATALGDAEARAGAEHPAVLWRFHAAVAAQRLGNVDEARALAADQLAAARRWTGGPEVAAALRLTARVGEPAARIETLQEAVTLVDATPARLILAGALCDLGDALRVDGRRADARAPLRRSADLAEASGAVGLRARALDSLAALGDRPRKMMFSGIESLTAGERRVAELAAVGRSNRDIAQELFITPKTVENHLGRVYGKLGINGRRELTGAIGEA